MRTIQISKIFACIEETDKKVIMLLNAEYSKDEKELIIKYSKSYNKEIKFITMKEFLFNEDKNILKIR